MGAHLKVAAVAPEAWTTSQRHPRGPTPKLVGIGRRQNHSSFVDVEDLDPLWDVGLIGAEGDRELVDRVAEAPHEQFDRLHGG